MTIKDKLNLNLIKLWKWQENLTKLSISLLLVVNFGVFNGQFDALELISVSQNSIWSNLEAFNLLDISTLKTHLKIKATITAYSSTFDQTDDSPFVTASNTKVRDGIVAANFLPFGTKIKIPELFGDKIFIVEDRMNRRYQDRIDIWFATRAEAKRFGKRQAEIVILDDIAIDHYILALNIK